MLKINKGIKAKLIISLVATTLAVLALFFIILDSSLKRYSRTESEKTILFLGQNASILLQKAIFNQDYNEINNIARSITLENFDYLIIYDNITDNIAALKDKSDVRQSIDIMKMFVNKSAFEKTGINIEKKYYTQYLFPVIADGLSKPMGFLVIGISEKRIESQLEQITNRLVIISTLLFLTLTMIIYFLSDKIVNPLKALNKKIGKFAYGDYAVRSDIKTSDEIGDLSENFNRMADKINEQIISIELYSKNLEKMVEERTEELLAALDNIKEKDKKLNQAEKINSLNSVVSAIAHEINNPLAIISGNVQLIDAKISEATLKKKLSAALTAIERIATLIDEINFFSAIKDLTYQTLIFSLLLSDAINRVVPGNIKVVVDGNVEDKIASNRYLLTLCLENIIQNSIDQFQLKQIQGEIQVNYYRDIYYFVVEIMDNGGGIEDPARVFDPFYSTFTNKKGLGLTFVYHAVQAMNGEIAVENIPNGAKVTLKLPELNPTGEG
ncbi:MAG TPA: HAMP domain-containing sensor histidine kinase [Candidatus Kapabacteria bacterium]|nr:HAMP domain-containing sensor histidine kinase [Candidatus Kapabacteria bacterium]